MINYMTRISVTTVQTSVLLDESAMTNTIHSYLVEQVNIGTYSLQLVFLLHSYNNFQLHQVLTYPLQGLDQMLFNRKDVQQ